MDPRLTLVTLGVEDLQRSLAFYRDLLGWRPAPQSVDDVVFFQAGGVVLALYPRRLLAEDARLSDPGGGGFGGIALAQNVAERLDVDRVLAEVATGGGRILKPAEDAFWGGRSGYFADPDGYPWEVAWNPGFSLDKDGILRLEPPRTPRKRRPPTGRRPAKVARPGRRPRRPKGADGLRRSRAAWRARRRARPGRCARARRV
jgi:catechol 2,3-dioxygenase-like lactoylglutathione lyase family enzyme